MRPRAARLAVALAVLIAAGCAAPRRIADAPLHLEMSGPIAVDVEVFAGDVTVRSEPDAPAARVEVVRATLDRDLDEDAAQAELDTIQWSAETVAGPRGLTLRVRATTMDAPPGDHGRRAAVLVVVPEATGVTVRTRAGDIAVHGAAGDIDLATNVGAVHLLTRRPLLAPVTLRSGRGDIVLRCRAESTGRLELVAKDGMVQTRVKRGTLRVDPGATATTVRGTLNDGANAITIRTDHGDVHFTVVEDPEQHGSLIVD